MSYSPPPGDDASPANPYAYPGQASYPPPEAYPGAAPGYYAPPYAAAPPPKKSHVLIVVIVVVVVILAAILGYIFFLAPHSNSSPGGESYSAAKGTAQSTATSAGYPNLVLADGIAVPSAMTVPSTTSTGSCVIGTAQLNGLGLPSSSPVDTGVANAWIFLFQNPTSYTSYGVIMENGAVYASGTYSCQGAIIPHMNSVPSNAVDSTQAAQVAQSNGGSAYMSNHTNAGVFYSLEGPVGYGTAYTSSWDVTYSVCPLGPGTGTGTGIQAVLSVMVNSTTQAVVSSSWTSMNCGGITTGPSSIFFGTESSWVSASGTHFLNMSVLSASTGLATGDFGLKILDTTGAVVSGWTASLLSPSGLPISSFSPTAGTWTSNVTVVAGDLVSLNTGTANLAGTGDSLEAYGVSGHSVTGSTSL